jgi:hypothetical protein
MRPLGILATVLAGLSLSVYGASDDLVGNDRIKVFLFAKPAFWSEVAVDAYNNVCIDLDNNLFVFSNRWEGGNINAATGSTEKCNQYSLAVMIYGK